MSYLARVTKCEHGEYEYHSVNGNDWVKCPGGTTTRIEPDKQVIDQVAGLLSTIPNQPSKLHPEEQRSMAEAVVSLVLDWLVVDAALGGTE